MRTQFDEIWQPVVGYEGLYEVSNYGKVRSLDMIRDNRNGLCTHHGKLLKIFKDRRGYYYVGLSKFGGKKHFFIHRLVARAFPEICGKWFEGCVINHKDENPANNVATNLEVCTQAYNMNYGSMTRKREEVVNKFGKPIIQISPEGLIVKQWKSACQIERELGIVVQGIRNCCKGKQKKSHGFKWMYA